MFTDFGYFRYFSVFFASYHFVSHPKNSVSLQSETSETNLFFRYFALLIFAFVSLRFASKQNEGTVDTLAGGVSVLCLDVETPPAPSPVCNKLAAQCSGDSFFLELSNWQLHNAVKGCAAAKNGRFWEPFWITYSCQILKISFSRRKLGSYHSKSHFLGLRNPILD